MPKPGFTSITIKDDDLERLRSAASDILDGSPVKVNSLRPPDYLRLLLDEHDKNMQEPEEET